MRGYMTGLGGLKLPQMQTLAHKGTLRCSSDRCLFTFIGRDRGKANGRDGIRHIARQRGHFVYEQGESAYGCFWLCQGQIKLIRWDRDGKQQFMRFVQPGQLFGVEALVSQIAYDEYAQATAESMIVAIAGREALSAMLHEEPALATSVVDALIHEIHEVECRLKLLLSGGACKRIAQVLLTSPHSEGTGGEIKRKLYVTNETLAALIGTSQQTVSNCLIELQHQGAINHQRGRVTILNPAKLRALL